MPVTRRETAWALLAALAVSAVWVGLAASQGALDIARNDDWSFMHNAFAFHDSGILAVTGWVQMMLIGQLVLAYPVLAVAGHSVAALQLLTALLGALLLWSSYLLVRGFLSRGWALLATASLAVGPVFGSLAVSFMTDIPAAAFQVLALAVAARALRTTPASKAWLVVASLIALFGFSIREYSLAALAVIWLLAVIGRKRYGLGNGFLATWTVGLGLAGVAMLLWRSGQLTSTDSPLGFNTLALAYMSRLPLTFGFMLLPVTAFLNPVKVIARSWRASRPLTGLALLAVLALTAHSRWEFVGNYWALDGGYSAVLRGTAPDVVPGWLWALVLVAATVSMVTLAGLAATALAQLWRARPLHEAIAQPSATLAVAFVVANGVMFTVLPTVAVIPVFDRYLVGVIPVAAGIAAWQGLRMRATWRRPSVGVVEFAVFALASLLVVQATAALDAARWRLADATAARLGIAPGNVDGGFDWYSFHTDGSPRAAESGWRWTWWTSQLDQRAVCASLLYAVHPDDPAAVGPDPGTPVIATDSAPLWLGSPRELVVLRGPDDCGVQP